MLTITFARHGKYEANNLNGCGTREIKVLSGVLKQSGFNGNISIVSSTTSRNQQTAKVIAGEINVDRVFMDENLATSRKTPLSRKNWNNEDILDFSNLYLPYINNLPKQLSNILVVTDELNVIGFSLSFSKAVAGQYFDPETGGAVSYRINTESWSEAVNRVNEGKGTEINFVHRCDVFQLSVEV